VLHSISQRNHSHNRTADKWKRKNSGHTIVVDPQNFFSNAIIGGGLSIWDRDGDEFHETK